MKKFSKAMDKITGLPVLKRRWLYILGIVIFTILFVFTLLMSVMNPSAMNRANSPQMAGAMAGNGTRPDIENGEDIEIPDEILDFFENGDFEIPENGDFEIPENGDFEIPEGGDFEIPEGGDFEIPEGGDFEIPEGGDFEIPEGGDFEIPTDRGPGGQRGGARSGRILTVVFGVLDALCIFMLIYVNLKKKRLERDEMQARWDQAEEEAEEADAQSHPARAEEKKRKHPYLIWIILVIIVVALILIVELLTHRDRSVQSQTEATLYSGVAERSDITTVLSGAGTLDEDDVEDCTIPEGVEIRKWYVTDGDTVEAGDLLAMVDSVSVMSTIVEVQDKLDSLDEALAEYGSQSASDSMTAPASGRVIRIYAEEDTPVADTMYEDGALMLLSLDGLMAVSVDTDVSVTAGDEVIVTLSDGSEVDGRVDSVTYRTVVITISDDGPTLGDAVSVESLDGEKIGEGNLYIHSEWKVTGYDGTVDDIPVTEGSSVSGGDTLLTLTDVETVGAYYLLLEQRTELVSQMETLFRIYLDGFIYASCDGVVSGIDTGAATAENSSGVSAIEYSVDNMAYSSSGELQAVKLTTSGSGGMSESNGDYGGDEDKDELIGRLREQVEDLQTEVDRLTEQLEEENNPGILYAMGIAGEISEHSVNVTYIYGSAGIETVELPERISLYKDGKYSEASADDIMEGDLLVLIYDGEEINSVIGVSMSSSDNAQGSGSEESVEAAYGGNGYLSSGSGSVSDLFSADADLGNLYSDYGDLSNIDLSALEEAGALADVAQEEIEETYGIGEQTILSITPQETMTFEITVDESDILSLANGQEADVVLDAFPGMSFAGTVTEVNMAGTNSGGNTKYTAEITIDREPGMLAGMNASAKIVIETTEDVLCIPEAALTEEGGAVYVYTDYDESTDELGGMVEVTTGISDGNMVEILSGMEEGTGYFYKYLDVINYE